MANEFKIYERAKAGTVVNGVALPINGNIIARQEVDVAGTAASSSVTNGDTEYVQLKTTISCYYLIGPSPQTAVADDTSTFLAAGEVTEEPIVAGTDLISVIIAS